MINFITKKKVIELLHNKIVFARSLRGTCTEMKDKTSTFGSFYFSLIRSIGSICQIKFGEIMNRIIHLGMNI